MCCAKGGDRRRVRLVSTASQILEGAGPSRQTAEARRERRLCACLCSGVGCVVAACRKVVTSRRTKKKKATRQPNATSAGQNQEGHTSPLALPKNPDGQQEKVPACVCVW